MDEPKVGCTNFRGVVELIERSVADQLAYPSPVVGGYHSFTNTDGSTLAGITFDDVMRVKRKIDDALGPDPFGPREYIDDAGVVIARLEPPARFGTHVFLFALPAHAEQLVTEAVTEGWSAVALDYDGPDPRFTKRVICCHRGSEAAG